MYISKLTNKTCWTVTFYFPRGEAAARAAAQYICMSCLHQPLHHLFTITDAIVLGRESELLIINFINREH